MGLGNPKLLNGGGMRAVLWSFPSKLKFFLMQIAQSFKKENRNKFDMLLPCLSPLVTYWYGVKHKLVNRTHTRLWPSPWSVSSPLAALFLCFFRSTHLPSFLVNSAGFQISALSASWSLPSIDQAPLPRLLNSPKPLWRGSPPCWEQPAQLWWKCCYDHGGTGNSAPSRSWSG